MPSSYQEVLFEWIKVYHDTTATLENPPEMLSATDWKLVESTREFALYQIATLLRIPELTPLGKILTPLQRQQCLDFIRDRQAEQSVCPCGRMTALDCCGECGLESLPCP
ncbi:hypothetical protein [Pseudanabaena sp. PCC 6802]|uniref:hypothetical protein n=1 Tax=Pseudanabaena sp. PCC 6802 TaxID=118173 RepID=UPI000344C670|nr:hypothetical protein [Pseudanabaena sp. PCC 6802]